MAACLLILQYVSHELSYDDFHAHGDRIYRVSQKAWNGAAYVQDACGYNVAGPAMQARFPEVSDYTYLRLRDKCNIANGNVAFREDRVGVASAHFLNLFSFPLLHGNPATALAAPNAVVISRTTARRYFGAQNPLGRTLRYNDGYHHALLTVTGVMEDMPVNSHMHLDVLVSYETAKDVGRLGPRLVLQQRLRVRAPRPGRRPGRAGRQNARVPAQVFSGTLSVHGRARVATPARHPPAFAEDV
jgi:putative ABC transport system permease protein